ncbi:MAG TPA: MBOAT family O-acyltransferase, partial [Candidatus Binatia bacterium]|nr:MBOAT family O-acyltransferase [Candidatus Binatia bacterium]
LASALLNHCFGLALQAGPPARKRKLTLLAALAFNLGLLAVFKYAAFFAANLNPLLKAIGLEPWEFTPWPMPLGISFFTFMAIAYLVEVYNRSCPAEKNFLHTALFIAFFPTVLAGPINRYSRLKQQMTERLTTPEQLATGIRRFIIGLGKKVLLADTLARTVDQIFAIPASALGSGLAWLGALCYALQIFLDFSGYSDMAIGLGRMFGFTFMENFNYPYMARSIKDFWNRWHISLSTWLRDFLFLPMAYAISRRIASARWLGIRAESWSYYPAMFLTMLLCGLWHGPACTFIAWGAYHGAFIMLERYALGKGLKRLWLPLQNTYALLVIGCGWILFRAVDLSHAGAYWRSMFGFGHSRGPGFHPAAYLDQKTLFFLLLGIAVAFPVLPALRRGCETITTRAGRSFMPWLQAGAVLLTDVFLLVVLLASVMELAMANYNPFIYFRF